MTWQPESKYFENREWFLLLFEFPKYLKLLFRSYENFQYLLTITINFLIILKCEKESRQAVPWALWQSWWLALRIYFLHITCLDAQPCPTLGNPMDCNPQDSSVHGISQARILEWVAISFSRGSSWSRDWSNISCIGRGILYHWTTWEARSILHSNRIVVKDLIIPLKTHLPASFANRQSHMTLPDSRIEPATPALAGSFFNTSATWKTPHD